MRVVIFSCLFALASFAGPTIVLEDANDANQTYEVQLWGDVFAEARVVAGDDSSCFGVYAHDEKERMFLMYFLPGCSIGSVMVFYPGFEVENFQKGEKIKVAYFVNDDWKSLRAGEVRLASWNKEETDPIDDSDDIMEPPMELPDLPIMPEIPVMPEFPMPDMAVPAE